MTSNTFEGTSWAKMVHKQVPNLTLNKKLCIVVCPSGSLFSRNENPNQPYSPEEIARDSIEACHEGACMVHLHVRIILMVFFKVSGFEEDH